MSLGDWIRRQQFAPGPIGWLVNPYWLARRNLHRSLRQLAPHLKGNLLDVGCGTKPYSALFQHASHLGVEVFSPLARERAGADVYYDGHRLPFTDRSFDALICNQVLEHVADPADFLAECLRVLRPGGHLLLSVPFIWDEHEAPHDYFRYTRFGLRHLADKAGLDLLAEHRLTAGPAALIQLLAAWLWTRLRTLPPPLRLALRLPTLPPLQLLGWLCGPLQRADDSLYLDHVQLWQRRERE